MNDHTFNPYQEQLQQIDQQIAENTQLLDDPELAALAQDELTQLEAQKKQLLAASEDYQAAVNDDGEADAGQVHVNCILELRPGAGGDEAKIWAADLLRMYTRFADILGLKIEMIDETVMKVKGRTTSFFDLVDVSEEDQALIEEHNPELLEHQTAYQLFRFELGVHRVQRVPATESQGRIHTSTASVAVLPEVSSKVIEIREEDLDWQFIRSSGAGGQSVNKTSSAVRLTHKPTGIAVSARSERKQTQNRAIALELLRSQLWEIEEEKRLTKLGNARKAIGRNMRAEKIRTYNFPQNRVTDHRIKESWHNLEAILSGQLQDVVWSMTKADLTEMSAEAETETE